MRHRTLAPYSLRQGIVAGLAIEGVALGILAAVWVLIGSYPLLLRMAFCPAQPVTQPCIITIKQ
jgi:hypothetical protein